MEQQQTSVKHLLRKFLLTKNSVTIRSNYNIMSCGNAVDKNSTHEDFENRSTVSENFKAPMERCTGCIRNSFSTPNEDNSLFEKNVVPTHSKCNSGMQMMEDRKTKEHENVNTQRFTIPIVILTDLSKEFVTSRRLI